MRRPRAVAFLDRDDTVVDDPGYLDDPAALRLLPGAAGAIRRLNEAGCAVALVTNQSGIGRGLLDHDTLGRIHDELERQLARAGARLDAIAACPHLPAELLAGDDEPCRCRKPAPGLVEELRRAHGWAGLPSVVVGDRDSDVGLARNTGCQAVRIGAGSARSRGCDHVAPDLPAAVDWWLRQLRDTPPRRVLVTRLRFLGDIVLSTPLLDQWRQLRPNLQLHYLCDERFAPVLADHPSVDRLHSLAPGAGPGEMLALGGRLRRLRLDAWVDLFGNPRSVLLCALARPGRSVGPDRGLRSRIYGERRGRPPGDRSAVLHHLDKLRPWVGEIAPQDTTLHPRPGLAGELADRLGWPARDPLLLHAGSTWPDKAWPRDHWRQLVGALEGAGLGPLWLLHPPGEGSLARELAAAAGGRLRLLPPLDLHELKALLSRARGLVANDGGPMHMSVALRRPTVGLFGPTEDDIWFPYRGRGPFEVVRRENPAGACPEHGTHSSRLAHLGVDEVLAATLRALGAT